MEELFSQAGKVTSASVITDKFTGKSKGFGFVEMENDDEARAAIEKFNGFLFNERNIKVSEARAKTESSFRFRHSEDRGDYRPAKRRFGSNRRMR